MGDFIKHKISNVKNSKTEQVLINNKSNDKFENMNNNLIKNYHNYENDNKLSHEHKRKRNECITTSTQTILNKDELTTKPNINEL